MSVLLEEVLSRFLFGNFFQSVLYFLTAKNNPIITVIQFITSILKLHPIFFICQWIPVSLIK